MRHPVILSVLVHGILALAGWFLIENTDPKQVELVDIEVAPLPPKVEALPAEVARPPLERMAQASQDESTQQLPPPPPPEEAFAVDAGVPDAPIDAPLDAPADAPKKKPRPDAGVDAGTEEPMVALVDDAGVPGDGESGAGDAAAIAEVIDAGVPDATELGVTATGSGSAVGPGPGSGSGEASIATAAGSGSGVAGQTTEPAVEGAETTAGTAANLLTYFPQGHVVTALIRFDRLRGTEWAAQTERLLRPMPDYRVLFGPAEAKIADKLDTLVISTPRPRDATATTLVAHTGLGRAALRDFLAATTPVAWSTAKGGMLGKRTGKTFPGDKRVFLSPFRGWFMLAQPGDLAGLTAPAPGNLDAIEAKGQLPAWVAGIRKIEEESGVDKAGPALVVTLGLGGQRVDLKGYDFGTGVATLPTPDRVSLAMELVKQGWLIRGNMRFATDKEATEFITVAESAKKIAESRAFQLALGKPVANVLRNLSFAQTGGRVSYATSISIADARALLSVAAQQLDAYYVNPP